MSLKIEIHEVNWPFRRKMPMITIDLIPDFLGSKLTLKIEMCQVSLNIVCIRII